MPQTACRLSGNVLYIHLLVQPGASRNELVGIHGDAIRIRLQAPPVDGRANKGLVQYLANLFDVARSDIEITHGHGSRHKKVRISNPGPLPQILDNIIKG